MSLWANSIRSVGTQAASSGTADSAERSGLAAGLIELMDRIRHRPTRQARLAMIERISLAPRQTLTLIEADGQTLLIATSPEGTPAFYPLSSSVVSRNRNGLVKAIGREEQA